MQKEAGEKVDIKKALDEIGDRLVALVEDPSISPVVASHLGVAGNHLMLALLTIEAAEEKSGS